MNCRQTVRLDAKNGLSLMSHPLDIIHGARSCYIIKSVSLDILFEFLLTLERR